MTPEEIKEAHYNMWKITEEGLRSRVQTATGQQEVPKAMNKCNFDGCNNDAGAYRICCDHSARHLDCCNVSYCLDSSVRNGLCAKHQEEARLAEQAPTHKCNFDGCNIAVGYNRTCGSHGDITNYCNTTGCCEKSVRNGLCAAHQPEAVKTSDQKAVGSNPHRELTNQERKERPLARGLLDYFPDALMEIAHVSYVCNEQHNPGQPMHWAKEKSTDHADCIVRHLIKRGTLDSDKIRHTAKVAWRAIALLQTELEAEGKWTVEREN